MHGAHLLAICQWRISWLAHDAALITFTSAEDMLAR